MTLSLGIYIFVVIAFSFIIKGLVGFGDPLLHIHLDSPSLQEFVQQGFHFLALLVFRHPVDLRALAFLIH